MASRPTKNVHLKGLRMQCSRQGFECGALRNGCELPTLFRAYCRQPEVMGRIGSTGSTSGLPVIWPQSRIQSCRISATTGSSGPGLATPREDDRKTTHSAAVQDGDPRSRHYRPDPIGPRVLLFQPRTFQPSASSPPRRDPPQDIAAQKIPVRVKAFVPEDGRSFEAWIGSAVPASVSPPTVSALPRVFAAIAASALDAAARLAVF